MPWTNNGHVLHHHHQLRASVLPIKACAFNSVDQLILAIDALSLRLWSFRKEVAVANFPEGTPGVRWLVHHAPSNFYFLFFEEEGPRRSYKHDDMESTTTNDTDETHPDTGIAKILDSSLNILVNFRPHEKLLAIELHPATNLLFTSGAEGCVRVHDFYLRTDHINTKAHSDKKLELGLEEVEWEPLAEVQTLVEFKEGHKLPIEILHFNAKRAVLLGASTIVGRVCVWQATSTKQPHLHFREGQHRYLRQLFVHASIEEPLTAIDLLSDILVCAYKSGAIKLWKADIFTPLSRSIAVLVGVVQAHQGNIHTMLVHSQSAVPRKMIISAGADGIVRVWAVFRITTIDRKDSISKQELEKMTPLPPEDYESSEENEDGESNLEEDASTPPWEKETKEVCMVRFVEMTNFTPTNNPPSQIKVPKNLQAVLPGKALPLRILLKAKIVHGQRKVSTILAITGGLIDFIHLLSPKRLFCRFDERFLQAKHAVIKSIGSTFGRSSPSAVTKHSQGKSDYLFVLSHGSVQIYDGFTGEKWRMLSLTDLSTSQVAKTIMSTSLTNQAARELQQLHSTGLGKSPSSQNFSQMNKPIAMQSETGKGTQTAKRKGIVLPVKQRAHATTACWSQGLRRAIIGFSDGTMQLLPLGSLDHEHGVNNWGQSNPETIYDNQSSSQVTALSCLHFPSHYVVSGNSEGAIFLWNLASMISNLPPSLPAESLLKKCLIQRVNAHPSNVLELSVVGGGEKAFGVKEMLISLNSSVGSIVKLWGILESNSKALQLLGCFMTSTRISCLAAASCEPEGALVVCGADNGAVEVWDIQAGLDIPDSPIQSRFWHTSEVVSVDANQSNRVFLTASQDKTLMVYKLSEKPLVEGIVPFHCMQFISAPSWALFCPLEHSSSWNILLGTGQEVWRVVVRDDLGETGLHTYDHDEDDIIWASFEATKNPMTDVGGAKATDTAKFDGFSTPADVSLSAGWDSQKRNKIIDTASSTGNEVTRQEPHWSSSESAMKQKAPPTEEYKWPGNYYGLKDTDAETPLSIQQYEEEQERAAKIKERRKKIKYRELARSLTRIVYNEMGEARRVKIGLEEAATGLSNKTASMKLHAKNQSEIESLITHSESKIVTWKEPKKLPHAQLAECPSELLPFWSTKQAETTSAEGPALRNPMEFRPTVKIVREIFTYKGIMDQKQLDHQFQRPPLAKYIYQYFSMKFGVVHIAEDKLLSLLDTVIAWRELSILRMFGRFIYLFDMLPGSQDDNIPGRDGRHNSLGPGGLLNEACDLYTEALVWLKERKLVRRGYIKRFAAESHQLLSLTTGKSLQHKYSGLSEDFVEFEQETVKRSHAVMFFGMLIFARSLSLVLRLSMMLLKPCLSFQRCLCLQLVVQLKNLTYGSSILIWMII